MCGIAGYATIGSDRVIDPTYIRPMLEAIHHRGPDDCGFSLFPKVAIGNKRLSIIDIAGGHQPIFNEDGSICVVYNGELYNARELRNELMSKGHDFRTRTDTEILVHLYEEEGNSFLKRLNGMFALAIYDQAKESLIVARDRYGVKPLVYAYKDDQLSFASEIKALRYMPDFDNRIDPEALAVFLGLFYIPDPWTIFRGAKKLRPGYFIELSRDGFSEHCYHDIYFGQSSEITDRRDVEREIIRLMQQSVQRQMVSDVPVGVLLSGGLDSRSVLTAAVIKGEVDTAFTIGFDELLFDESGEANNWCKAFNVKHIKMTFTEDDFINDLETRMKWLDEPYALWCNVATAKLARTIKENGFKVVLSGEGGMNYFVGIQRYMPLTPQDITVACLGLLEKISLNNWLDVCVREKVGYRWLLS